MICATLRKGATFLSRFLPRWPNGYLDPAKSRIVGCRLQGVRLNTIGGIARQEGNEGGVRHAYGKLRIGPPQEIAHCSLGWLTPNAVDRPIVASPLPEDGLQDHDPLRLFVGRMRLAIRRSIPAGACKIRLRDGGWCRRGRTRRNFVSAASIRVAANYGIEQKKESRGEQILHVDNP
jgi:hypothetical protein